MIKLNLHYAEVTDNDDPNKKGFVQIRILPQFKDIKESLLPWARPFKTSGFDGNNQSMSLPEIGAKIWTLCDDKFITFYYLYGSFTSGLFDYDSIKSSLDSVTELSDSAYPNIDFQLLNDGSIRFHNRTSGDHGFLHNTGTYTIIDTNGYVTISESSGNKTVFDNSGILIQDSNGNSATYSSSGISIEDSNGNGIEMTVAGIQLKTGDSSTWMPNTLPACLFTGAPHGGPTGGITKLKGG